MGSWGYAILSDDVAKDIYDDFMDAYDDGDELSEIRTKIEESFGESRDDEDERGVFWFALAKAQWKCGALDPDVHEKVKEIVASESDLGRWRETGGTDLAKRKAVLAKLLAELESPNPRPRKRNKKVIKPLHFQPGDCIQINFPDGTFGAALVLDCEQTKWGNWNLVGVLHYMSETPPDIAVFEGRDWLRLTFGQWKGRPDIGYRAERTYKKADPPILVVNTIKLRDDDPKAEMYSYFYSGWYLGTDLEHQFAWELENGRPKNLVNVNEWLFRQKYGQPGSKTYIQAKHEELAKKNKVWRALLGVLKAFDKFFKE